LPEGLALTTSSGLLQGVRPFNGSSEGWSLAQRR
jgi:hypothetical protein